MRSSRPLNGPDVSPCVILPILHLGTIVLGFLSASVKQALCAACEYSNQWRATTASPTARCLTRVEPNGSTHYESNVVCTVPVPLYADSRATVGLVAFSDSVAIDGLSPDVRRAGRAYPHSAQSARLVMATSARACTPPPAHAILAGNEGPRCSRSPVDWFWFAAVLGRSAPSGCRH